MPIHLTNADRRHFLKTLGTGIVLCSSPAFAEEGRGIDQDLVIMLNDTHIGEKHPSDSAVPTHLRQIVGELTQRQTKPACVLINGDLALKDGQAGDYQHFAKLIEPLRNAKIETHLTLGNHDNREVFYQVLKEERSSEPAVASLHVSVVQTQHANFFLLDSLKETMVTQGIIGRDQLRWLTRMLDLHSEKPAIIVTHHNPRLGGDPVHFPGGLIDSQELWNVLTKRTHVKAYIHGHIHDRGFAQHGGIHIINTLATSYVADPKKSTTGWTSILLNDSGALLTSHTTTPSMRGMERQSSFNGELRSTQRRVQHQATNNEIQTQHRHLNRHPISRQSQTTYSMPREATISYRWYHENRPSLFATAKPDRVGRTPRFASRRCPGPHQTEAAGRVWRSSHVCVYRGLKIGLSYSNES